MPSVSCQDSSQVKAAINIEIITKRRAINRRQRFSRHIGRLARHYSCYYDHCSNYLYAAATSSSISPARSIHIIPTQPQNPTIAALRESIFCSLPDTKQAKPPGRQHLLLTSPPAAATLSASRSALCWTQISHLASHTTNRPTDETHSITPPSSNRRVPAQPPIRRFDSSSRPRFDALEAKRHR